MAFLRIAIVIVAVAILAPEWAVSRGQQRPVSSADSAVRPVLVWDQTSVGKMLFTELPGALRPEVAGEIVCVQDEFVFSLMQSLYYDRASDVFVVWVGLGPGEGLRMLRFKCEGCRGAGVYRTVNGPDLTLADLGELKMIRGKRGGSFLFARVGDGEWRLVSALGAQGSELFIDYGRDGFISQVRDSNSRTLLPVYKEGRLTSVVQMWPGMRGKEMGVTIMR